MNSNILQKIKIGASEAEADIASIPALEDCHPKLKPHVFNILVVIPQPKSEKTLANGAKFYLPDSIKDEETHKVQVCRIVRKAHAAFSYEDIPSSAQPQIGETGLMSRFAGVPYIGPDGLHYRLILDKEFIAGIEE